MAFLRSVPGAACAFALVAGCSAALAQTPVGPEFQANTYTIGIQGTPALASAGDGRMFVPFWRSSGQDGSSEGVYGQRYDSAGNRMGAEFRVNSYTTNAQHVPHASATRDGRFVVVWRSDGGQDGGGAGVFSQRYDSAGNPLGGEFRVNTTTSNDQYAGRVAWSLDGRMFVVVWVSVLQDGSTQGVYGQRYDSAGNPLGGEFQVNAFTTGLQFEPAVATTQDGRFVVTWSSDGQDGSTFGVFGRRYDSSGNALGGEFQVNTYTTGSQRFPQVASTPDGGSFLVVWSSDDGSSLGVFGRRYDSAGNPLGGEFQVNTYTTQYQRVDSVAAAAGGRFVVAWRSNMQGTSVFDVFGRRYDSSGQPEGGEFQVNTYTTSSQTWPVVASTEDGRFVVVWESFGSQDGNSVGTFGQRYAAPDPVFQDGFE